MKNNIKRPSEANNIVGQNTNIKILERFIKNYKIPHSLIFHGPKGVGKASTAFYFSKLLFSSELPEEESSQDALFNFEEEQSTVSVLKINEEVNHKVSELVHPDLLYIRKKEDKKTIEIDDVRNISSFFSKSSSQSKYKIAIIDTIDDLSVNASNTILKCLEEPNKDCMLILLSNNINNALQTILSRCIKLYFPYLSNDELNKVEGINIDDKVSKYLDNSPGQIISIANNNISEIENLLDQALSSRTIANLNKLSKILKDNPDKWSIYKKILLKKLRSQQIDISEIIQILDFKESRNLDITDLNKLIINKI